MDLIKFPMSKGMHIELQDAELVQNWATATWAERYFESGEFTLTADTSSLRALTSPCGIARPES